MEGGVLGQTHVFAKMDMAEMTAVIVSTCLVKIISVGGLEF